jgi:uncharacterized membrane protein YqjE
MVFLQQHLLIFIEISAVCLTLTISGFLFKFFFLGKKDKKNFEENGIFGYILIGFIALLINFFYPLNIFINNIFFILIILFGYKLKYFEQGKFKLIKKIFISSLFAYIFIIYSNVNNPDAFLYHLPYSKILNDDKIIIGLTNLHSRFGHISIFQYISSIYVNSLFHSNGVLLPISLLPSFFFIYCYKKFKNDFKNKDLRLKSYIIFLFLIISIYSFNRYSGWGNDAQAHIFYYLSIIYFLDHMSHQNDKNNFNKLMTTSLFTFLIKPFYLISCLMPLVFFFLQKEKFQIIKSKIFIFLILFSCLWFLKNFLTSSCLIYPINSSCIENTSWYSKDRTNKAAIEGEGWSKDWGNRDKNLNSMYFDEYTSNFNWVKTWLENHFKIVLEKILPVIIFLILNLIIFYFTKCFKKNYLNEKNNSLIILYFINLIGCFAWFAEFPVYRYGSSYIHTFFVLTFYFILLKNINLEKIIKLKSTFILIIYLGFFGIFAKNFNRVLKTENKSIYPIMFDKNFDGKVVKFYNKNGIFIHYRNVKGLCGYSKSPCRFKDTDINKDIFFGYKVFK